MCMCLFVSPEPKIIFLGGCFDLQGVGALLSARVDKCSQSVLSK